MLLSLTAYVMHSRKRLPMSENVISLLSEKKAGQQPQKSRFSGFDGYVF